MIEARSQNDPVELARSLRGMGVGSQPSLWEELAGLRVPTLAVAGNLDGKILRVSRRMAALSPNVRAEVPGAYLALLERFLGAL
jgi:2-succinyl-6-hydroxy-2,4-cyclohexadiene-1-carboxylate synthase